MKEDTQKELLRDVAKIQIEIQHINRSLEKLDDIEELKHQMKEFNKTVRFFKKIAVGVLTGIVAHGGAIGYYISQ